MNYYVVDPDVAISIGENTVLDVSRHPPEVSVLHIIWEGWFGDDILQSFPVFVFTERLVQSVVESGLSGVNFQKLQISLSDQFRIMFPDVILPKIYWAKIDGVKEKADFFISEEYMLVISKKALDILSNYNLERMDVADYYNYNSALV